ncbi:hypothetical protein A3Q56_06175 [Intoshia linei]|uniref:Uncharacterized protein n=1 Tax=Intoshia linei TaxID=1819745 RepID=A0A177AY38_9BILA|nr:hypothetical protein A3Q56_06175 [Intoshia linei]
MSFKSLCKCWVAMILKSAEALKCKSKIYGDKQLWYNHDDNKNYFKVTPKRIQPWCDTKTLIQNRYGDSGAWYYGNCSNQPEKTSKKTFADSRSKSNWYHEMSLGKPKTVKFDARVIGQDATSNMEKSRDGSILKIIQGVSISNNQENKVKYTNVKSSSSDWFEHKPRKYPMTSRISNNYKFMKKSSLKSVVTHNCDKNGTVSFKSHSKLTKSPNYHGKHDLNIQKLKNSPIGSDIFSPAHVRNTIIPGNVNVPKLNLSQISVRSNNSQ